jgi:hypothetical protein
VQFFLLFPAKFANFLSKKEAKMSMALQKDSGVFPSTAEFFRTR